MRRVRLTATAALLLAGVGVLASAPALADTVTVPMRCDTVAFGSTYRPAPADVQVRATTASTAPSGGTATVSVTVSPWPTSIPVATTGVSIKPVVTLSAGSAVTGSGATSTATSVAARGALPGSGAVAVQVPATGTVGSATSVAFNELALEWVTGGDGMAGARTTCRPTGAAPVVATFTVAAAASPSPTPTPTPTPTAGATPTPEPTPAASPVAAATLPDTGGSLTPLLLALVFLQAGLVVAVRSARAARRA